MKLLLGIAGSIAATLNKKIVDQIFEDVNPDELFVYYTEAALKIVNSKRDVLPWWYDKTCTYANRVFVVGENDEWGSIQRDKVLHVDMGKLDLIVVAPATANTIAKIAHGFADNMLTSTILVRGYERLIVAPAMNTGMYNNPITQKNIATIRSLGCSVVDPVSKLLYCGDEGIGALAPASEITKQIKNHHAIYNRH